MSALTKGPATTLALGGRHSRRVDRLRFILPVTALLLLFVVMAWPWLGGGYHGLIVPVFNRVIGDNADPMRMQKPRYVGRTNGSDAYEVTASSAFLDPKNPNRIHLDQLVAVVERAEAEDVRVRANEGYYHRNLGTLDLAGDLELRFGDLYTFNTSRARVDFGKGQVIGETPVTGEGPMGTLAAERFDISDGGKFLRFEGGVQMVYQPEAPSP